MKSQKKGIEVQLADLEHANKIMIIRIEHLEELQRKRSMKAAEKEEKRSKQ